MIVLAPRPLIDENVARVAVLARVADDDGLGSWLSKFAKRNMNSITAITGLVAPQAGSLIASAFTSNKDKQASASDLFSQIANSLFQKQQGTNASPSVAEMLRMFGQQPQRRFVGPPAPPPRPQQTGFQMTPQMMMMGGIGLIAIVLLARK